MPYADPDSTDPMTLHGVVVETDDAGPMLEMAQCFVQEFARLGFDADRIWRIFTTRGYAGPFMAFQTLGEDLIRACIDEQFAMRNVDRSPRAAGRGENRDISLPVLNG